MQIRWTDSPDYRLVGIVGLQIRCIADSPNSRLVGIAESQIRGSDSTPPMIVVAGPLLAMMVARHFGSVERSKGYVQSARQLRQLR